MSRYIPIALAFALGAASAHADAGVADAPGSGAQRLKEADRLLHHEDDTPANLRAAIEAYEEAVALGLTDPDAARAHAHRGLAWLRLGDLAKDDGQKLRYYALGTAAADEGIKRDKACADAWFYRGATLGRYGETKGVLKALSLLGDVKGAMQTALKLDPSHSDAMLALGKIDEAVPAIAGGSDERAEAYFRKALKMDPHFTRAMLDLAELLIRDDRLEEAKKLCDAALAERTPSRPGEWRKFDVARARKLLQQIADE